MRDVLTAMIKAHEIQGCIALENSFNKVGLDHVVLVKVASTAVVAQMLGLTRDQALAAVSLAWVDGQSLRTYRHAPNTGSRKSWAAGDATSRAVRLALMAKTGEMGYPTVLTAKTWGFYDVSFKGQPSSSSSGPTALTSWKTCSSKSASPRSSIRKPPSKPPSPSTASSRPWASTAADIRRITIRTHEACIRIIDKKGPLNNPADRDHCIQYMIAIPLLFGRLTAADYEDTIAAGPETGPRIDALRALMETSEVPQFTADYHDPDKRSIANALARRAARMARCLKKSSSTPSAIAADAPTASPCLKPSSKSTSPAASPPRSSKPSSQPPATRPSWKPCPFTSTSTSTPLLRSPEFG